MTQHAPIERAVAPAQSRADFDPEKALEALIYVASRVNQDMYRTLKTIYIADKCHLERFGSLIFGSSYLALPFGPVPDEAYDIVKFVRGSIPSSPVEHAIEAFAMEGNNIIPRRDPDLSVLSRSDIDCLNVAIDQCQHLSFQELKKLTHDDAYLATPQNSRMAIEAIAATLPNSAELIQHLADPHPGEAE